MAIHRVRSRLTRSSTLLLAFALAACGGAEPTSPDSGVETPPKQAPVASVSLGDDFTVETHTTKQLTPVLRDSAGTVLTDREIRFSSSDTTVATVSTTGLVAPVAMGTARISAISEGVMATASVTVVPMPGTVVIRVLTTDPTWGQETIPGWPGASPVKDTTAYSLYDVEIGRKDKVTPIYVSLYKFRGFSSKSIASQLDAQTFPAYLAASRLYTTPIAPAAGWEDRSKEVLTAFESVIDEIMKRERPTRIVLEYSGHGGPTVFFEGALTFPDAREMLKYIRASAPSVPLILDFSTNCDVGYFDFVVHFHDVADYMFASERLVGGYSVDDVDIDDYLATLHDRNLYRFWRKENDLEAAFDAVTSARTEFWQVARKGLVAAKAEQSLAVYDLSKFDALMDALAQDPDFDPIGLEPYDYDIGTYAARSSNTAVTDAFRAFQLQYVSDRDIVPWTMDTRGFSVDNSDSLANFLTQR